MGCGKSKHAVVTETTVIKSMKSDDGKETRTTKTVKENGDSKSVQEIEKTSSVVEDTKKETVTTKTDPIGTAKTDNVEASAAPTLSSDTSSASMGANDVSPRLGTAVNVKEDEEVKDSNVATPSNEVVKEDDEKREAKIENVPPIAVENVVGDTVVVKDDEDFEDSKEENVETVAYVTPVKTIDDSSNQEYVTPKVQEYVTPKVQEQKDLAPPECLTKVETKKEEDVEVKGADISKAGTSLTAESEKVPTASEANVVETEEKESETK